MSKRVCYLHIGTGKTGTSAIQYALAKSSRYLLRRGFSYPDVSKNFAQVLAGKPTIGNGGVIGKALRDKGSEQVIRLLEPFSKGDEHLVISHEGFWQQSAKALSDLVEALRYLDYDARCLIYFRPQAEMVVAQYLQRVKTDKTDGDTLNDFAGNDWRPNKIQGRYNWYLHARKCEKAFGIGNLTVKWYPALRRQGVSEAVKAIFDWIGAPLVNGQLAEYNVMVNPTPGREALVVLERVNCDGVGGKVFSDEFLLTAHNKGLLGSKVELEPAMVKKIELASHKSNTRLLKRYCPELSLEKELSLSRLYKNKETLDIAAIESLTQIASEILHKDQRIRYSSAQLLNYAKKLDPDVLVGIKKVDGMNLVQNVFNHINDVLANNKDSTVWYSGLGGFRVRTVESRVNKNTKVRKRIIFRLEQ